MPRRTHKPEDERSVVLAACRALIAQGVRPAVKRVGKLAKVASARASELIRELSESGELDEPDPTERQVREIEARMEAARRRKAVEVVVRRVHVSVPRSSQRLAM